MTPGQQGYIYQLLALWFLGCSQMIAQVLEIPEDKRNKLFNLCIQESLRITEDLLGKNKVKL